MAQTMDMARKRHYHRMEALLNAQGELDHAIKALGGDSVLAMLRDQLEAARKAIIRDRHAELAQAPAQEGTDHGLAT